MFVYTYQCSVCDIHRDELREVEDRDKPISCDKGHEMKRLFNWRGFMSMGDISFQAHYNPAFGKEITRPGQIKEEIRRLKYEKGMDLVEVGNEKLKDKPKEDGPMLDKRAAYQDLKKALKKC